MFVMPYSLYLHIPFCRRRCGYCDFNTYAGQSEHIPAYVDALCAEILAVSLSAGQRLPVHTVYFGGGTPSLLSAGQVDQVLHAIWQGFDILPGAEVTLEANPGTVSLDQLIGLRAAGVNRLSFGMQSAQPDELQLLDRQHVPGDEKQAVDWARRAGFDNLSLDLIYGIPFQSLPSWQQTLETALELDPQHLSLYSLTVERGTPLSRRVAKGQLPLPDDDAAADQYEYAIQRLAQAGFEQYEISNWARRGSSGELLLSHHNLQYWISQPYLGFGAGAHGYAAGYRTANVMRIATFFQYMRSIEPLSFPFSPANSTRLKIDERTAMQEMMMVGLRLVERGVPRADFKARFGLEIDQVFAREVQDLLKKGLLEWGNEGQNLRLTLRGKLLGNQVFMQFVG